jgi:Mlc titration factor MtfA (ptsG expression regulator)
VPLAGSTAFRYLSRVASAWTRWRRERIRRRLFSREWLAILARTFPRFARLGAADQEELKGHIQVFLAEKRFEGAADLKITDEIRVTIAAQACLLLLHRGADYYPGLVSIIVYPSEYIARRAVRNEIGLVSEGHQVRLGETGARGALVLSWDSALRGASDVDDCRNVVFHEFAHQLDAEAGGFDGAPLLPLRSMYDAWSRVLGEEFATLRGRLLDEQPTDLDPYAATSPAEFFAVATECFFQRPRHLHEHHPALFGELSLYYQQDPRSSADK